MTNKTEQELEEQLNSFDLRERQEALHTLLEQVTSGAISLPATGTYVNLHAHTIFSYNPYGYSPTGFAWLARKAGLDLAGIVDFDVLDGVEEFLSASRQTGLKGTAGMETRVFVPEFADREINSPGEPGISYHMGVGFSSAAVPAEKQRFFNSLKETAGRRNRELIERVNSYTAPVTLDYEKDVLPLTPAGNATERHLCLAYARKAADHFKDTEALRTYWSEKLGLAPEELELPEGKNLQAAIRSKTMKKGGVGYVAPDGGSFPTMAETNTFFLACGAIPTFAWLNGESAGEQAIDELLDTAQSSGVAAVNIIPDRNFTAGVKDRRLENLYTFVHTAESRNLPVIAGTEMNSPGNKFVDSFETDELAPLLTVFRKGAHIIYAHTLLNEHAGLGYLSSWAREQLPDMTERNSFYQTLGERLNPYNEKTLTTADSSSSPDAVLQLF